jgi:hypothetical protein
MPPAAPWKTKAERLFGNRSIEIHELREESGLEGEDGRIAERDREAMGDRGERARHNREEDDES